MTIHNIGSHGRFHFQFSWQQFWFGYSLEWGRYLFIGAGFFTILVTLK